MTRHHAGPNINILLTRNLSFDSDVRKWSHLLMIMNFVDNELRSSFLLTDLLSFGEVGSFEIGRPKFRGWKNFRRRWTRRVGGLENWTIFMDVPNLVIVRSNSLELF